MALSYDSNWVMDILPQSLPEVPPELPPEIFFFHNSFGFDPSFEPEEQYFYPEENYYPYFSSPPNQNFNLPDLFLPQEFNSYNYPKRQRTFEQQEAFYADIPPVFENGFVSNPATLPELTFGLPEFDSPAAYDCGVVTEKKQNGGAGALSAQSIAARHRRRKISERTQELGKLIPGGQKMNTAEMFQAAYKYIKYLQAQVRILEFMGSIQENEDPSDTKELQDLLTSTCIQEKLYSAEKCLVPQQFVEAMAKNEELPANSAVLKDIKQLVKISG